MIENRDKGIEIVLGFEDPGLTGTITKDAGGRTRYGIAEKYNPDLWINGQPSLEEAQKCYLEKYWIPAGCDDLPYPMDIAVFNASVNPGSGAVKLIRENNPNCDFEHFMRGILRWYARKCINNPNLLKYLSGWTIRVLDLWNMIEKDKP